MIIHRNPTRGRFIVERPNFGVPIGPTLEPELAVQPTPQRDVLDSSLPDTSKDVRNIRNKE